MPRLKYRNVPTVSNGMRFDSRGEAGRYGDLLLLQRAGEIRDLKRQVRFQLAPPCRLKGATRLSPGVDYVADFTYFDVRHNREVIEDVKGHRTDVYKLKRHFMKALLGLDIDEVQV